MISFRIKRLKNGRMAEWLKAHAWKACIELNFYRGFESLFFRHPLSLKLQRDWPKDKRDGSVSETDDRAVVAEGARKRAIHTKLQQSICKKTFSTIQYYF